MLGNYYDKYVKPAYEMSGLHAPAKDLWVREMPKNSADSYWAATDVHSFYLDPNARSIATTALGALSGAQELVTGMSYAGIKFSQFATKQMLHLTNYFGAPTTEEVKVSQEQMYDQAKAATQKISNAVFDNANFWSQTHPSKSWQDHVDSGLGEALVQLPLYEALGAIRLGVAGKVGEALGPGKVANFTKALMKNKAGAFVARRLGEATDAYMGGVLQNSQNKLMDMLGFMGYGAGLEAGVALGGATTFFMKKFGSAILAVGGKPFQKAVTDEAAHELEHGINSTPETLLAHLTDDPAKAGVVTAEKMTLSQMGRQQFGKAWNQLSKGQRMIIRDARERLTQETINELPLHQPEIAKANAQKQVAESAAQSPKFGKRVEAFEKEFGMKVSDASVATEADRLENQVGVKNSQNMVRAILNKVGKAQYSMDQKFAMHEEPKVFAQLKSNTGKLFKKLYALSRQEGGFVHIPFGSHMMPTNSQELSKWLKDLDSDDFLADLKDELGAGKYKFESDAHALLWANYYRKELPKQMATRVTEELEKTMKGGTQAKFDTASQNLERHMSYLAYVGRLQSQKNIFRSTLVSEWTHKTKWQKQLLSEVENLEFQKLSGSLSRHPEIKAQALAILKNLQKARRLVDNAETDRAVTNMIKLHDLKRIKARAKSGASQIAEGSKKLVNEYTEDNLVDEFEEEEEE